ncbi:MAG: ATP-binding cassette domain-containing protein [Dehalococcoidia bacterium]
MFLEIKDLCKNFGGLAALSDFSMTVEKGHMASLIGPNGAGKTTIFNLITGVIRPSSGSITFQDARIPGALNFDSQEGLANIAADKGWGKELQILTSRVQRQAGRSSR